MNLHICEHCHKTIMKLSSSNVPICDWDMHIGREYVKSAVRDGLHVLAIGCTCE
jgi:hypothetical protein